MNLHRTNSASFIAAAALCLGLAASVASEAAISRLAFGSCAFEDQPQPIWDTVLSQSPHLWAWAGDNVYGDTEDMEELRQSYQLLSEQPGYQQLKASGIPILGTWDDHDYGANDAGSEYPRRAESQQVLLDFLGVPEDSPRRARRGVYHAEIHGDIGRRVQVILLDTRYHRSPLQAYPRDSERDPRIYFANQDPEATILGEEQWTWLKGQLLEPAELRLIVSSIQFVSSEHRFEKWSNFPREQRRLLDLIRETQAEGVVILSGDRHHAELSRLDAPDLYPLYDLTASGLNESRPMSILSEANRHRLGRRYRGHHFGLVDVDWEQPDPLVRLSILDRNGARPIDTSFPLSSLSFDQEPHQTRISPMHTTRSRAANATSRVDGTLTDWTADEFMVVEGKHIRLRFRTPETLTLTGSPASVHLLLDFDGDERGTAHFLEPGTDLEVVFSPRRAPGERGWRPIIQAFDPEARALESADLGLAAGPTHASHWFEVRISRDQLAAQLPAAAQGGVAEFAAYAQDKTSDRITVLATETLTLPRLSQERSKPLSSMALPSAPAGALRVVSLNTLWGSQFETPFPFGRVLRTLNADILLLQEWSRDLVSEAEVVRWFRDNVDSRTDWHAMASGTAGNWSGTLLVSRHPIRGRVPRMTPVETDRWSFPARFAAGLVDTPLGTILAGSVHLKSSGSIDSPEDERRLAEADAINRIMVGMKSAGEPAHVVLGGDFNLLGSTDVVERATRMLDQDGSHLSVAVAPILGDPELMYTFGRQGLRSRLDYVTYSDNSLRVVHAFVLDARLHDEASLSAMGLEAEDTAATDHLPVVVDLLPWE